MFKILSKGINIMNTLVSVVLWKIKSIWSKNNHISSVVIDSEIDKTASLRNHVRAYHISLGRYSYVARNTLIQNTTIGSFCSISEGCNIGMPSHPAYYASTSPVFLSGNNYLKQNFAAIEYEDCPRTIIGHDVWIGANAQIKSGISIGNGAIIGAGAVVTKDVPSYAIVGGIPAKVIKYRFSETVCDEIKKLAWWDMPVERLKMIANCFDSPEKLVAVIHSKGWDK